MNDRAKIESALAYIPADCGYEDWWKIGAAIYSEFGASGFSIWDYWSAKSSKYSPRGMNDKYNSFANIHDIKIATVYRMAIDNGWQPPKNPKRRNRSKRNSEKHSHSAKSNGRIKPSNDRNRNKKRNKEITDLEKNLKTQN